MIPSVPTVSRIATLSIAALTASVLLTEFTGSGAIAQNEQVNKSLNIKPNR